MLTMHVVGKNNTIQYGANVIVSGAIRGDNNTIAIGNARVSSGFRISINGDNNRIRIGDCYQVKDLTIACGNHVQAHDTAVEIGGQFSIEPGCSFLLYNSGNRLSIGRDCLFSNNITIRCGESPHLIFDLESGEYLDVSEGVFIGDHVWLGERVYVTKRVTVPDDCVVAACSVVTRRFSERNAVIGGNPARVVKQQVRWIRNSDFIEAGSIFHQSFLAYQSERPNLAEED